MFCFVCIGLHVFDCFLFVLFSLVVDCFGIFVLSFLYRGGGHSCYVQLSDRLCIYYAFIYDFLPPFLLMLILLYPHSVCRDWYECVSECT